MSNSQPAFIAIHFLTLRTRNKKKGDSPPFFINGFVLVVIGGVELQRDNRQEFGLDDAIHWKLWVGNIYTEM